ncbi:MAG: zinc-dependent peptidase [Gammaproteobacteria bacterium]
MTSKIAVVALIATVLVAVLTWQIVTPLRRRRRRQRLLKTPLSVARRETVAQYVAIVAHMPPPLQSRLEGLVNVFLDEKRFIGCAGLQVDDTIAVVIATQACLLLVNRPGGCFDPLHSVLVYPRAFYVEHENVDEHGVISRDRRLLSGESWSEGQVVVSWDDARSGGAHHADGYNVVVHEFAHQLDGETGTVNGAPLLDDDEGTSRWAQTMREEYAALKSAVGRGAETLIDPYGATHPAEFFAVLSEVFYEQPRALRDEHPSLYQRLREFYHVDPAQWR